MKTRTRIFLLLLLLCGLSTLGMAKDDGLNFMPVDENQAISKWIAELLSHKIDIPEKYAYGSSNSTYAATAVMYVQDFESAWWECIKQFSKNSGFKPQEMDRMNPAMRNRWILPVRQEGYHDGYLAAEERVAAIKRRFGDHATELILRNSGPFFVVDREGLLTIIPRSEMPRFKAP